MSARGPEVGEGAPDFTLPGIERGVRRDFRLSDYRGRKVALAFPVIGVKRSISLIDSAGIVRRRFSGAVRAIYKRPRELAQLLASFD